jgi:hypothetical protein
MFLWFLPKLVFVTSYIVRTCKKQIHSKFPKTALFDSLNRTVSASPPVGGAGCGFALVSATLHSHAKPSPGRMGGRPDCYYQHGASAHDWQVRLFSKLRPARILSALVFAAQSPYPGRQSVVNSRNGMCNKP